MSKETKNNQGKGIRISNTHGEGYAVSSDATSRLFGTIFNIIEAIGLSNKQEEALRPLIRGAIWNVFDDGVFISSDRYDKIREDYYQAKKEANKNGLPMSAI